MSQSIIEVAQMLTVPQACDELRAGHMVLVYDDRQENEAALCLAAQFSNTESLTFFKERIQGEIYAALSGERLDALHITFGRLSDGPFYRVAYPFATGTYQPARTTRGLPLADLLTSLHLLVNPLAHSADLAKFDQLLFLRSHPAGIAKRRGYVEGIIDLLHIAGLEPVAAVGKIVVNDDNSVHHQDFEALVAKWHIGILSLDDLIRYRKEHLVHAISETLLPTELATFRLRHFRELETGHDYLALLLGDLHNAQQDPPLVRIHSACATGDLFGSQRCDCQAQMHRALQEIAHAGRGLFLYLPQEGRGIGLSAKLQAYVLQEQGIDTIAANRLLGYPADARDYTYAIQVLHELNITSVRLLTNNPAKIHALQQGGIQVQPISLETPPTASNLHYLQAKQNHFGHTFSSLES